jgi:hypothetical protein
MRAKWILIGATVVVLAAGLYWLNGARTYDDLDFGGISSLPAGGRWVEQDFDREIAVAPWRPDTTVDYAVSVRNDGGRSVEITGVGWRPEEFRGRGDYQVTPVRVRMMPGEGLNEEGLIPFAAVEIGPGEQRTFVLTERLPPCTHFEPGSVLNVDGFEVRFKAFMFSRTQTIELRTPIQFERCGET